MNAAIHMSRECQQAYQQLRSLTMSSASQRLARLMLEWAQDDAAMATTVGIKVALTHEEIAQVIAMSRETWILILASFRKQNIAKLNASTLLIQNMAAIHKLAVLRPIILNARACLSRR